MQKKPPWALSTRAFALLAACFSLAICAIAVGLVLALRAEPPQTALLVCLLLLLACLCAWVVIAYRKLYRPYMRLQRVLLRFLAGSTVEELFSLPTPLTPEVPNVLNRLSDSLDRQTQLKDAMKQAEYLALQNQINPHFLYNTLEAIRGDALLSGMNTIVDVAEALATYFRYTISKVNQLVTLSDELRNVESYFTIQKYRYGDRINMELCFDPEDAHLLTCRLPKLTLQPIVENAIIHGLEPKVAPGLIRIRFESTKSRLLLSVSDNGVGVAQADLDALLLRLEHTSPNYVDAVSRQEGGIALVNVNNRLRLLFGEQYGLTIASAPGLGTDVTITLPLNGAKEGGA